MTRADIGDARPAAQGAPRRAQQTFRGRAPETMRQALARFFADNGWPADGGYDAPWAEAAFGMVRYRVPNVAARREALRVHDLHHVLTGYATEWRGEAEISAWELGSGVGSLPYASLIALWGLFTGLLGAPRRTFAAFVRGRRSRNLLSSPFDPSLLEDEVGRMREQLSIPGGAVAATTSDVLAFVAWSIPALLVGVLAVMPALGLVGLSSARSVLALLPCGGHLGACTSASP
jgi:hypothetical protein